MTAGRFPQLQLREAANEDALAALTREVPDLPQDYLRFLALHNGGEGFVGPMSYVMLWAAEELVEYNRYAEVSSFAPGLFLFGSNGGGESYAFDLRDPAGRIVSVPNIGMELRYAIPISATFDKFLDALSKT